MIYFGLIPIACLVWYLIWQGQNFSYWKRALVNSQRISATDLSSVASTVIIPARNEAKNIAALLTSLSEQSALDKGDSLVLVDDHSTDATILEASNLDLSQFTILNLGDYRSEHELIAHKKAALTFAIRSTDSPLIVTTDADCYWSPQVLRHVKAAYQSGAEFICGPVLIANPRGNCQGFQALDLIAYMFMTAAYQERGEPILANGAHLSFSRKLFIELEGYAGVDHLPSGDDVLLLQKAIAHGGFKTAFLVNPAAVVTTQPMPDWSSLWAQRIRWAGKTGAYTNPELKKIQALNFLLALSIVTGLLSGCWFPGLLIGSLIAWMGKAIIDYFILAHVCRHFQRDNWMSFYWFAQLVQPIYLVGIGGAALLGVKSEWKGRG